MTVLCGSWFEPVSAALAATAPSTSTHASTVAESILANEALSSSSEACASSRSSLPDEHYNSPALAGQSSTSLPASSACGDATSSSDGLGRQEGFVHAGRAADTDSSSTALTWSGDEVITGPGAAAAPHQTLYPPSPCLSASPLSSTDSGVACSVEPTGSLHQAPHHDQNHNHQQCLQDCTRSPQQQSCPDPMESCPDHPTESCPDHPTESSPDHPTEAAAVGGSQGASQAKAGCLGGVLSNPPYIPSPTMAAGLQTEVSSVVTTVWVRLWRIISRPAGGWLLRLRHRKIGANLGHAISCVCCATRVMLQAVRAALLLIK